MMFFFQRCHRKDWNVHSAGHPHSADLAQGYLSIICLCTHAADRSLGWTNVVFKQMKGTENYNREETAEKLQLPDNLAADKVAN